MILPISRIVYSSAYEFPFLVLKNVCLFWHMTLLFLADVLFAYCRYPLPLPTSLESTPRRDSEESLLQLMRSLLRILWGLSYQCERSCWRITLTVESGHNATACTCSCGSDFVNVIGHC